MKNNYEIDYVATSNDLLTWFALQGIKSQATYPIASPLIPQPIENVFMMKANGNGMYPDIKSGDMLIIEWTTETKNGDMVVLMDRNKKFHCKYMRKFNNQTFFENSNKEIFEFGGYRLIGVVISIFRTTI